MSLERRSVLPSPDPLRIARFERLIGEEFSALELRNERRASRFVAFVGVLGLVVAGVVAWRVDRTLGAVLAAFGAGAAVYYSFLVPWLLARAGRVGVMGWVNVTIEVSIPSAVSLVDVHFMGGEYALTSTPPLLTFVAVVLSGLRLQRRLCVYAGSLGAVEYLLVYAAARLEVPAATLASKLPLGWEFAFFHALFLAAAGVLAAVVAHAGTALTRRVAVQVLEKERMGDLFGAYVSPKALERALSGDLALSGERRRATILFSDVRGFTALAFAYPPEQVVAYLNQYFSAVCEAVGRHGGMVNKFIGDGMLAVFGAPEPTDGHALAAARAALDIQRCAAEILRPDGQPTRTWSAVHTGSVVLGTIGSPQRKDYTVIGDTVNLAARIERLCRKLDVEILLSEQARAEAGPTVLVVPRGEHLVRGRAEQVCVHELTGVADDG